MTEKLCSLRISPDGYATLSISGDSSAAIRTLLEHLQRQLSKLATKDSVRGVLITGYGESFCRTVTESALSPGEAAELSMLGQKTMFALEKIGKPCIAFISGATHDLALEIALSCDFITASNTASFGFTGIATGRIPFCGGSQRLTRLVGKAKAKELLFSGDIIDAAEAYRIKLVNRLYPHDTAQGEAEKLLARICSRSPNALRVGGEVLNAGSDMDLHNACLLERNAFALCFTHREQRQGMQAFLDKQEPQYVRRGHDVT